MVLNNLSFEEKKRFFQTVNMKFIRYLKIRAEQNFQS